MSRSQENPYQAAESSNLRRHEASDPVPAKRSWRKAVLLLLLTAVVVWLIAPWLAIRMGELFWP